MDEGLALMRKTVHDDVDRMVKSGPEMKTQLQAAIICVLQDMQTSLDLKFTEEIVPHAGGRTDVVYRPGNEYTKLFLHSLSEERNDG